MNAGTHSENEARYFDLTIVAVSPKTKIWLSDSDGHPVQMEVGELRTGLLQGKYFVEFELGNTTYPVTLYDDTELTESEITSGPSCPRPKIRFLDE